MPALDRTATLRGVDANNDGIRDDIANWIAAQPITADRKLALSQFARSMQESVLLDAANDATVRAVSARHHAAVKCVVRRGVGTINGVDALTSVEKYTANTKERVEAYLKYNNARNGATSKSPPGDGCV